MLDARHATAADKDDALRWTARPRRRGEEVRWGSTADGHCTA